MLHTVSFVRKSSMGVSPFGVDNKVPVETHRQRLHGPPSPPQAPETAPGGASGLAMGPPGMIHFPSRRQRPTGQGFPVLLVDVGHGRGDGDGREGGDTTVGGGAAWNASAVGCCVGCGCTRNGDGGTSSTGAIAVGRVVRMGSGVGVVLASPGVVSFWFSACTAGGSGSLQETRVNATNETAT